MPLALKPHATSIERAFSILEMLDGTRRGWNISEISRKQKIPKSSAHVIVLALERMGYLKRENGTRRYKLGLKICSLGRGLMNDLALPEIALPHMRWLVEQTRLTAHLGVLEKGHIVFIQKIDGPGMVKFDTYVGKRRSPLHRTGQSTPGLQQRADHSRLPVGGIVCEVHRSDHHFSGKLSERVDSGEAEGLLD